MNNNQTCVRIGNIAFQLKKHLHSQESSTAADKTSDYYIDIVKYFPNSYYKKEKNYQQISDEWYSDPKRPYFKIHKDCFQGPECAYSLATMNLEEEPSVQCVGIRPFELEKSELETLTKIVKMAQQYILDLLETL